MGFILSLFTNMQLDETNFPRPGGQGVEVFEERTLKRGKVGTLLNHDNDISYELVPRSRGNVA